MHEPVVVLVVLGEVGLTGLRDQPEQPGAEGQPEPTELRGQRTVGHPHVRRALGLVVQGQVGHVRVQQRPGPAHDGGEDGVDVTDRGQVAGGLVERGHLRLALPVPLHLLADPQRHRVAFPELLELCTCDAGGDRDVDHLVEGLARGV
jgi:hypothetical protein